MPRRPANDNRCTPGQRRRPRRYAMVMPLLLAAGALRFKLLLLGL